MADTCLTHVVLTWGNQNQDIALAMDSGRQKIAIGACYRRRKGEGPGAGPETNLTFP